MNSAESIKLALEHSRALFIYHADQRIKSLNFYFVAIAVFLSGFALLANSYLEPVSRALVGIVLAYAGIRITHLFRALDLRNQQLVECDETLLKWAEGKMANMSDPPQTEWQVAKLAEAHEPGVRHYKVIVPSIFFVYKLLSVLGGVYSICPLIRLVANLCVRC